MNNAINEQLFTSIIMNCFNGENYLKDIKIKDLNIFMQLNIKNLVLFFTVSALLKKLLWFQ